MLSAIKKVLGGKLHQATVTHADINYEGSILIPKDLMDFAGFANHEAVHVWNISSGSRLETYIIEGEAKSGKIAINGAAAHLVHPGDKIIVANFIWIENERISQHQPRIVFLDAHNKVSSIRQEIAPKL